MIFSQRKVILACYLAVSLLTGIWQFALGPARYDHFLVLNSAFDHLVAQQNLYLDYPDEYTGRFSYHPIVVILFAPIGLLSAGWGMLLWLLLIACILFYAIGRLPLSYDDRVLFWWLILVELGISLNLQLHDPLIGALGLLTLSSLQRGQSKRAALYPVLACCLHPYAILLGALFVFYPNRRRYLTQVLVWALVVCIAPLYFTTIAHFSRLYMDWAGFLSQNLNLFPVTSTGRIGSSIISEWEIYLAGGFCFTLIWVYNLVKLENIDRKKMLLLLAYCFLWISVLQNGLWTASNFLTSLSLILFFLVNKQQTKTFLIVLSLSLLVVTFFAGLDMYVADWIKDSAFLELGPGIVILLTLQCWLLGSNRQNDYSTL